MIFMSSFYVLLLDKNSRVGDGRGGNKVHFPTADIRVHLTISRLMGNISMK